jgi:hypothetical protein
MVYLHVTIQIQRGKLKEWTNIFEKEILPLLNKFGQKMAGAWNTTVGTYDEVTHLYVFENLAGFAKIRQALSQDPQVQECRQKIAAITGLEISKLMEPLSYSPLR